jgi:hypothetical protein
MPVTAENSRFAEKTVDFAKVRGGVACLGANFVAFIMLRSTWFCGIALITVRCFLAFGTLRILLLSIILGVTNL